jgi:hypothetical protein
MPARGRLKVGAPDAPAGAAGCAPRRSLDPATHQTSCARALVVAAALGALVGGGLLPTVVRGQGPPGPSTRSWEELTPEQRERVRQHYQRFQRLPEERRRAVEERYRHWRELPPQEQQRLRRNYESYQSLNPEQRREFREKYRRWKSRKDDGGGGNRPSR